MGHMVKKEKIIALVILILRSLREDTIIPHLCQYGVDVGQVFGKGEMQFQMNTGGGVKGTVVIRGRFDPFGPAPARKDIGGRVKIFLLHQHIDVAAGAHPRLRIMLPQKGTLQRDKGDMCFLQDPTNAIQRVILLAVAIDGGHLGLFQLIHQVAGRKLQALRAVGDQMRQVVLPRKPIHRLQVLGSAGSDRVFV